MSDSVCNMYFLCEERPTQNCIFLGFFVSVFLAPVFFRSYSLPMCSVHLNFKICQQNYKYVNSSIISTMMKLSTTLCYGVNLLAKINIAEYFISIFNYRIHSCMSRLNVQCDLSFMERGMNFTPSYTHTHIATGYQKYLIFFNLFNKSTCAQWGTLFLRS